MKKSTMKPELSGETIEAISQFGKKMDKNRIFYDKFNSILAKEFDQILKEEINICICCGVQCVGKSIGPHYKNSKKCANFKREREGRGEESQHEQERHPLNNKDTNVKMKVEQGEKERQNRMSPEENYDELNEYFDSF